MEKKSTIFLGFSDEELYVLLVYLGVSEMWGLEALEKRKLSVKKRELLLGVAERALVAREILLPTPSGNFKLADIPHALLRTCANFTHLLQIDCAGAGSAPLTYYYCHARKMYVLHTTSAQHLHGFLAFGDQQAFSQSAFAVLGLREVPPPPCPPGQLSKEAYRDLKQAARQGVEQALGVLSSSNLPPETAAAFIEALHNPVFKHALRLYQKLPGGQEKFEGFTLLMAHNGLWILTPLEQDVVNIEPATLEDVSQRFSALMADW
ncbi:MAG: hypothetical protein WCI88_07675 [Chloroflexota bacterium]